MIDRLSRIVVLAAFALGLTESALRAQEQAPEPQEPPQAPPGAVGQALPGPPAIPEVQLGPVLPTTPVRRGALGPNATLVDARVLPRDKQSIWVLDFAFKPLRLRTVEIPGKGRRVVHYLYYQVINNTGQPRMFVPQFTLVTNTGKRYEDSVLPQVVDVVKTREDQTTPLLGAVDIIGIVPPNPEQEGVDNAVYGVAIWEGVDPAADRLSVYVRGLSDGYQILTPPGSEEEQTLHKTLRIDFIRLGDEFNLNEREIRLADPPYEWIYW